MVIYYRGFRGEAEKVEGGEIRVTVQNTTDTVVAACKSFDAAAKAFKALVEDYLALCQSMGKAPCRLPL